jgi:hypothetical protein
MASDDSWAVADIACPECRSTNLVDLGPGPGDPRRHSFVCRDCGGYFPYPPQPTRAAVDPPRPRPPFSPSSEPLPRELEGAGYACLTALKGLSALEGLEVSCRQVLTLLQALQASTGDSTAQRASFNEVCRAVEDWLAAEINGLRFPMP